MTRFFLENLFEIPHSKISNVNYTKLTFIDRVKMTIFQYQFKNQNFTFATLTNCPIKIMNYYTKSITFLATMLLGISVSVAQDYSNPDSATYDPYAIDTTTSYSEAGPTKPVKKPYVRFAVPFDTITELVTYTEVVNEEEAGTDSLYWRAKRWIAHEYGKRNKKQVVKKDDKKDYKLVMEGEFPLYIEANKFSKSLNGKVVFDMEIKFKEGRYKYKINNIVHVIPPPPGDDKEIKTYFEFYRKSTINPKGNDMVLIAADKKFKAMIKDLRKYCKEPVFVDDDDW